MKYQIIIQIYAQKVASALLEHQYVCIFYCKYWRSNSILPYHKKLGQKIHKGGKTLKSPISLAILSLNSSHVNSPYEWVILKILNFFSLTDWKTHSLLGVGPKHNSISIYGLMKNVNSCNGRFYVYKGFLFATFWWKFLKVILWKSNNIVCFAMVIISRKMTHSLSTIQSE